MLGIRPDAAKSICKALIDVDRNAGALADGADTDVTVIDVPCDLVRIVGAAAGEGRHPHDSADQARREALKKAVPDNEME
jgi:hypothetical protein